MNQRGIKAEYISFVDYEPKYAEVFRKLNEQWITEHFRLEPTDLKALENPQEEIIDKGGAIIVVLLNEKPVGVCALIKMDDPDFDFELAKMAIAPEARGKNIGRLLGQATIEKARKMGCKNLYLESNTKLKPAVSLFERLGFKHVTGRVSPYERGNVMMGLRLQ